MLITRSSCQLCAPARDAIRRACDATGARWAEVRVDGDRELAAEFGDRVPVVLVDGDEVASLAVDEGDLVAELRARGAGA